VSNPVPGAIVSSPNAALVERHCMDNVFIERVWRSLKYEEVHLKAYADGHEARAGIGEWNTRRFHESLGYKTPMDVWSVGETAMDMPLRLDNARALPR
jgi:putative transposase